MINSFMENLSRKTWKQNWKGSKKSKEDSNKELVRVRGRIKW